MVHNNESYTANTSSHNYSSRVHTLARFLTHLEYGSFRECTYSTYSMSLNELYRIAQNSGGVKLWGELVITKYWQGKLWQIYSTLMFKL